MTSRLSQLSPNDTYKHSLAPPIPQPASDRIKNILPKYHIQHILGSGGFANVYGGTDTNGRSVAVKVPQFDMEETLDMSVVEKFATEAEIWEKLDHENIVELYDSDERPFPHLVMELMNGGSLKGLMRNVELTVEESVQIMLQMLEGLSYAHRMATVHRDLKPENILFTSKGVAKITDWGIGKYMASASLTKTVGTKGTLAYSAPEQFAKRKFGKVDWQTDIFQVGVLFYEMLTGINPFEGQDMAEVMGNVLTYHPNPPSSYNPDVPKELDRIIMGALEKDKNKRWRTDGMLFQLKEFVKKRARCSPEYSEQRAKPTRPLHGSPRPDQRGKAPQKRPITEQRPQPTRPPREQSRPAQSSPSKSKKSYAKAPVKFSTTSKKPPSKTQVKSIKRLQMLLFIGFVVQVIVVVLILLVLAGGGAFETSTESSGGVKFGGPWIFTIVALFNMTLLVSAILVTMRTAYTAVWTFLILSVPATLPVGTIFAISGMFILPKCKGAFKTVSKKKTR